MGEQKFLAVVTVLLAVFSCIAFWFSPGWVLFDGWNGDQSGAVYSILCLLLGLYLRVIQIADKR